MDILQTSVGLNQVRAIYLDVPWTPTEDIKGRWYENRLDIYGTYYYLLIYLHFVYSWHQLIVHYNRLFWKNRLVFTTVFLKLIKVNLHLIKERTQ